MTDNDIIKALERCIKSSHFGECFENKCPLVSENGCKVGKETLYPYALDLINRQRAEIERLRKVNASVAEQFFQLGITEFEVRLKKEANGYDLVGDGVIYKMVDIEDIDQIAKELKEGANSA